MRSIGVMQPYLFPYVGYFQLIDAVDIFVIYDNVDFIKNGWINRNKILINAEAKYLTIPCISASSNKKIIEIEHGLNNKVKAKLLKKIKFAYGNAPFFKIAYPLFKEVLDYNSNYIVDLAIRSIEIISRHLELNTVFKRSSYNYKNNKLDKAEKLINICKKEGVRNYINSAGGKDLYDKTYFKKQGIHLKFLESQNIEYKQFNNLFVPRLSIIDVIMFNAPDKIKNDILNNYKLN